MTNTEPEQRFTEEQRTQALIAAQNEERMAHLEAAAEASAQRCITINAQLRLVTQENNELRAQLKRRKAPADRQPKRARTPKVTHETVDDDNPEETP